MSEPRVVLVDDHALFRAGVRSELQEHVQIAGEAGTVDDAVALIAAERPDVVLLDVHMPDGGGVEVIRRVSAAGGATPCFLALSVSDAAEDVIAVIRAGARGYVTKTISADELADAIRRVNDGDAVFSPRLAGFVLDAFAGAPPPRADDEELEQLTAREREVLQLIARGYMYKEIAQRLSNSPKTVEAHVSAVLRKLQLSSRHAPAASPPGARSRACSQAGAVGAPPAGRAGGRAGPCGIRREPLWVGGPAVAVPLQPAHSERAGAHDLELGRVHVDRDRRLGP